MAPEAYLPDGSPTTGWIGVDLDGTLAEYHGWIDGGGIGAPVPAMLARVKAWIANGIDVRIVTARVAHEQQRNQQHALIWAWCLRHLGRGLPVTHQKDMAMIELWDDRAVTVEVNTGKVICHPAGEWTP